MEIHRTPFWESIFRTNNNFTGRVVKSRGEGGDDHRIQERDRRITCEYDDRALLIGLAKLKPVNVSPVHLVFSQALQSEPSSCAQGWNSSSITNSSSAIGV